LRGAVARSVGTAGGALLTVGAGAAAGGVLTTGSALAVGCALTLLAGAGRDASRPPVNANTQITASATAATIAIFTGSDTSWIRWDSERPRRSLPSARSPESELGGPTSAESAPGSGLDGRVRGNADGNPWSVARADFTRRCLRSCRDGFDGERLAMSGV
jgi:hypothetical protein